MSRWFYVTHILVAELNTHLNCTVTGEDVPEAERAIRIIKERARCIISSWPFKLVPVIFKIHIIKFVILWMKSTPQTNFFMPHIYNKAIMTGLFPNYQKHCLIVFGKYTQLHNPIKITNWIAPQTSPAIATGPTSDIQGIHRQIIIGQKWVELPLPQHEIDSVEDIAMKEWRWLKKNDC